MRIVFFFNVTYPSLVAKTMRNVSYLIFAIDFLLITTEAIKIPTGHTYLLITGPFHIELKKYFDTYTRYTRIFNPFLLSVS